MEKVDYIQDVKSEICLFTMEGDTHLINNLLKNSSWTTLSVSGKKISINGTVLCCLENT